MPDKVPPQAIEMEMAVLGSMLIEKSAVDAAFQALEEGDFYKEVHRKVFRAIQNLVEAGREVDPMLLVGELRRLDWLGEAGGPSYIDELVQSVSTAAHVDHYAAVVREKSILRDIIAAATEIAADAYEGRIQPDKLMDQAETRILKVSQRQQRAGFRHVRDLATAAVDDLLEFSKRRKPVTGIATGLTRFDTMTAGLQPGDLILIAARPSQGKTALALNIAAHAALEERVPVAFFSLEMTAKSIMQRLLSCLANVDGHAMRTGFFRTADWPHLTGAADRLRQSDLYIHDSAHPSVLAIRSDAKRLGNDLRKRGKRLGLVLVDYLQLMTGGGRRFESRQQDVAEVSRGLKALARELNIPVVALSQLNRRIEEKGRSDGRPQLSDLRESGALEQDADVVAFIYREAASKPKDPTLETKAELIIAKQRNGPTGSVHLQFLRNVSRFGNAAAEGDDAPESGFSGADEEEDATLAL